MTCTKCGEIYNLLTDPPPDKDACKCGGKLIRRQDDQPEAIKTRLNLFHEVTEPLLNLLKEKGILVTIDGSHDTEEVFTLIQMELQRKGLV